MCFPPFYAAYAHKHTHICIYVRSLKRVYLLRRRFHKLLCFALFSAVLCCLVMGGRAFVVLLLFANAHNS